GRPWIAREIAAGLDGATFAPPAGAERLRIVLEHFRNSLDFYGPRLGLRIFRKHLAAYIEHAPTPTAPEARRAARAELCRLDDPAAVEAALAALWGDREMLAA
ncbi:MAG TPA: tRNA-dihydrouridine synthase, partial [Phenylobacterium sp.]